jgi:antibiotic biosynthesis monooxygenase (ABM) superfamily enzyme
LRRRWQKLVGSKKQKPLRHEFWNCTLRFDTADNFPAWIASQRLPPR